MDAFLPELIALYILGVVVAVVALVFFSTSAK